MLKKKKTILYSQGCRKERNWPKLIERNKGFSRGWTLQYITWEQSVCLGSFRGNGPAAGHSADRFSPQIRREVKAARFEEEKETANTEASSPCNLLRLTLLSTCRWKMWRDAFCWHDALAHISAVAPLNAKRANSVFEKDEMCWATGSEEGSFVLTAHWAL